MLRTYFFYLFMYVQMANKTVLHVALAGLAFCLHVPPTQNDNPKYEIPVVFCFDGFFPQLKSSDSTLEVIAGCLYLFLCMGCRKNWIKNLISIIQSLRTFQTLYLMYVLCWGHMQNMHWFFTSPFSLHGSMPVHRKHAATEYRSNTCFETHRAFEARANFLDLRTKSSST